MMKLTVSRLLPVVALVTSFQAMGLSIRDDLTFTAYETQVNTSPYDATGRFSGNASGTLIAPDWVLSAAHVNGGSTFTASDGTTVGVDYSVVFGTTNAVDGTDFRLYKLSSSINSVTIATLHDPTNGTDYSQLLGVIGGEEAVYTGTGETGNGITGAAASGSRQTLAGTNIIDTVGVDFNNGNGTIANVIGSDFDDPDTFGPDNDPGTSLEVGLADKDSGGGVWVDLGDGPVLIGVHSAVSQGPNNSVLGEYGQVNYSTVLTDAAYNWIQTTVPEPSSLALLLAGGALLARRRR